MLIGDVFDIVEMEDKEEALDLFFYAIIWILAVKFILELLRKFNDLNREKMESHL